MLVMCAFLLLKREKLLYLFLHFLKKKIVRGTAVSNNLLFMTEKNIILTNKPPPHTHTFLLDLIIENIPCFIKSGDDFSLNVSYNTSYSILHFPPFSYDTRTEFQNHI